MYCLAASSVGKEDPQPQNINIMKRPITIQVRLNVSCPPLTVADLSVTTVVPDMVLFMPSPFFCLGFGVSLGFVGVNSCDSQEVPFASAALWTSILRMASRMWSMALRSASSRVWEKPTVLATTCALPFSSLELLAIRLQPLGAPEALVAGRVDRFVQHAVVAF